MLKKLTLLIVLIATMIFVSNCSSSYEKETLKKAHKYMEMAQKYKKKNLIKGYNVYTNKALLVLLKYMQRDTPTVKIRSLYVNNSIDLGHSIISRYAMDPDAQSKLNNLYENLNAYIYKIKTDTLKIKKKDGKIKTKVKIEKKRVLPTETYNKYAQLLIDIADTIKNFDGLRPGFKFLQFARNVDSTLPAVKSAFKRWNKELAEDALSRAKEFYEEIEGEKDPDPDPAIAAEYFTRLALKYDPTNKEANDMIKKIYPVMVNIYSAYDRLMNSASLEPEEFDPDIDNNDVLMAITSDTKRGTTRKLEVSIYNNSYNPIEIRPEVFALVDANGKYYYAKRTNTKTEIPSKVLDTEFQENGILTFTGVPKSADIVKLIYHMERPLADGTKEVHESYKFLK